MFGLTNPEIRELSLYLFLGMFVAGLLIGTYASDYQRADKPKVYRAFYITYHERLDLLTDWGRFLSLFGRRLMFLSSIPAIAFMMIPPGSG